jgi:hypothetical protein
MSDVAGVPTIASSNAVRHAQPRLARPRVGITDGHGGIMSSNRITFRHGLIVGLIAYISVCALYTTLDVLAARGAFFTVDVLGKAVFRGLRDPAALMFPYQLDAVAILGYNAVHLALTCGVGLLVIALVRRPRRHPVQAPPLLTAFLAGAVVTTAAATSSAVSVPAVLPWWSIVVANLSAAALAGAYLLRRCLGPAPLVRRTRVAVGT